MHQRIHAAGFAAVFAHLRNQAPCQRLGIVFLFFAHSSSLQHIGDGFAFITAISGGNCTA